MKGGNIMELTSGGVYVQSKIQKCVFRLYI